MRKPTFRSLTSFSRLIINDKTNKSPDRTLKPVGALSLIRKSFFERLALWESSREAGERTFLRFIIDSFFDCFINHFTNAVKIIIYIAIGKPQNANSVFFKRVRSLRIVYFTLLCEMLCTVNLDHKTGGVTIKICNKISIIRCLYIFTG